MIWMYGGAFNPPTIAHHNIMLKIQKRYPSDKIFVVPVGDHYNKSDLVSFHHRKSMLLEMNPSLTIVDLEQHIPFQGTIHTMRYLKETTGDDVGFIIGADQLETIHQWIEYESLFHDFQVIIITRPNYDTKAFEEALQAMQCKYEVIQLSLNISSTSFRETLNEQLLHQHVLTYIKKHHLYEESHV
ncbi:MAG: nicotinate-nicotinamide nucleotide adenylyltransferase [Acholeplasmataceae bacterium]